MGLRTLRRFFLPSRTIAAYMVKMHLSRFFGLLLGLTVVLLFLDLLANSDNVLDAEGATWVSLLSYVGLRGAQLVAQFLPFAVLIASLLTFATLNQHSEVIIMKAAGMSAHNILLPLILASTMIAGFHFIFNETALVRSNAELDYWRANDFAVDLPPNTALAGRVWIKEGNQVILAESVN
ncbi:MAG: LptF/LptG family permease, partial [Kordiimonadaceae bacterium]|nr:LptF/LptG family permease [Kordiimonadaceae bacterium]